MAPTTEENAREVLAHRRAAQQGLRLSKSRSLAVGLSVLFWLAVHDPLGAWIAGAGTVALLALATAGREDPA